MSPLCSPRADLWPFYGFLGKPYIERENHLRGEEGSTPRKGPYGLYTGRQLHPFG